VPEISREADRRASVDEPGHSGRPVDNLSGVDVRIGRTVSPSAECVRARNGARERERHAVGIRR
jgi:hypothetical protein